MALRRRIRRFPTRSTAGAWRRWRELAPAWAGDAARLERLAAAAFAIWSREADLRVPPGGARRGAGHPDRRRRRRRSGSPSPTSGTATARRGGIAPLTRATICFNPEAAWSTGTGPLREGQLDLGTVLAHEIGHAIGLDHPGATGALMGYSNQGSIDHLMPGDIAGAVALYGPAQNLPACEKLSEKVRFLRGGERCGTAGPGLRWNENSLAIGGGFAERHSSRGAVLAAAGGFRSASLRV